MSDSSAGRAYNTVTIPAALVFPGDPVPNMGHDVARIPVRVVWRESDTPADPTAGTGPAGAVRLPNANAMPGDDRGGDDPAPGVAAASGPERPPSPDLSGGGPIAKFLEANDALDRISGGGNPGMPGAAAQAANKKDGQDPNIPVPVVDDSGRQIDGARGPMMRPAGLDPQIFIKQGLADRNDVHRILKPDTASTHVLVLTSPARMRLTWY